MPRKILRKFHGEAHDVDVVLECTGFFTDKEKQQLTLKPVQKEW